LALACAIAFVGLAVVAPTPAKAADTGGYPHADAFAYNAGEYDWRVDENNDNDYVDSGEEYSARMYNYKNCTDYVAWKLESSSCNTIMKR
jgi:hypothetical protein